MERIQARFVGVELYFENLERAKQVSGDKIIGKGRLPTNNRVTNALRMAASTLRLSNTYLGAQFRRLRTRLGAPVAIKAMAAKLARLVYRMLRYGMPFIDRGEAVLEQYQGHPQRSFTRPSTANCKLTISSAKPPISDSKSSKLRQRSFWRAEQ
jgi:hypothetical protein